MIRTSLILKAILLFLISGTVYTSCKTSKPSVYKKTALLGFYNLENLFDTINDPQINDEEFLPEGRNAWSSERYNKKLHNLSVVIDSFFNSSQVILGVCEIENENVLKDLSKSLKGEWSVYTSPSPDARGIDVGLLVKGNIQHEELLSKRIQFPDYPDLKTRDLHINRFSVEGKTLLVGVCHFPSRRGGQEASEPKRVYVAQRMNYYLDSMLTAYPNASAVVMGDFNDEPQDSSLKVLTNLSGDKYLYNLMASLKEQNEGSYRYRGNWNMLDQILVSNQMIQGSKGFKIGEAEIYKASWLFEQEGKYAGNPLRTYGGSTYLGGYSDHLPVRAKLNY